MKCSTGEYYKIESIYTDIGWTLKPKKMELKGLTRYQKVMQSFSQNDYFPQKEQRIQQIKLFENEDKHNWSLTKDITTLISEYLSLSDVLNLSSTCKTLFNLISFKNNIWKNFLRENKNLFDKNTVIDFFSDVGPDGMSWKETYMNKVNNKIEVVCVLSDPTMQKLSQANESNIKFLQLPDPIEQIECFMVIVSVGTHSYFRKIKYTPKPIKRRRSIRRCD